MSQTVCPNCAKVLAEGVAFCDACGTSIGEKVAVAQATPTPTPVQQPQPAYAPPQQPQYQQPPYQQPAQPIYGQPGPYYPPQPMQYVVKPARPGRGFGIASMVLGIIGMVYAVVILIEMIALAGVGVRLAGMGIAMVFATIVYAVFGILAVSFAIPARKRGYVCGVSTAGLALGIASLSLNLIAAVIGAIGL